MTPPLSPLWLESYENFGFDPAVPPWLAGSLLPLESGWAGGGGQQGGGE